MALLTPNATYKMNGVTVNEKIIPDGTVWKDASKAKSSGFSKGDLYKKQQKLTNNTGKAKTVTIHNTSDLAGVYDDGEQYTRATYNENMGSARVHFYVDDVCAWQNLKAGTGLCTADPGGSAEVSWHAGDGAVPDGGNMTSLSMEIIMGETSTTDSKAYDNGARIAAWLLWKHGLSINDLVTHTYWVNKIAGKKFSDVDLQCTNPIYGEKWCPTYIFRGYDQATALRNWKAFKAVVKGYLDALNNTGKTDAIYRVQCGAFSKLANAEAMQAEIKKAGFDTYLVLADGLYKVQTGAYSVKANADAQVAKMKAAGFSAFITTKGGQPVTPSQPAPAEIKVGSNVKVKQGAKTYDGGTLASFVYDRTHTVAQMNGDRVVIAYQGTIVAAVNKKDLILA